MNLKEILMQAWITSKNEVLQDSDNQALPTLPNRIKPYYSKTVDGFNVSKFTSLETRKLLHLPE